MSENELQQIPENELQQQGKEHRAKRRKLAKSSECFYEELQNVRSLNFNVFKFFGFYFF